MATPPTVSTTLLLDLDPNAIVGLVDNDPVPTLEEVSGNNRDFTQATSTKRPTYKTNMLNGFPAIVFDGVDDTLRNTATGIGDTKTAITVFLVMAQDATESVNQPGILTSIRSGGSNDWDVADGWSMNLDNTGGSAWAALRLDGAVAATGEQDVKTSSTAYDTFAIATLTAQASAATRFYVNGTAEGVTSALAAVTFKCTQMTLGARSLLGVASDYAPIKVARVLFYDGVLSTGDRATIHSFLQDTYSIAVSDYSGPLPGNPPIPVYDTAGSNLAFNSTPVNVVMPTTAAGKLPVLIVTHKAQNTGPVAVNLTTPANWTLVATGVNGTAVTGGNDVGSMRTSVFIPTNLDSLPASGSNVSLAFSATPNAGQARIMQFSKPVGDENHAWNVAGTVGYDDTANTTWLTTNSTDPDVAINDVILLGTGLPTDIGVTWASETVTQTGVTFGTVTNVQSVNDATGGDSQFRVGYVTATAGKSTAAPVHNATLGGTTTNAKGTTVFARIRLTGNPLALRLRGEVASMRRAFRW